MLSFDLQCKPINYSTLNSKWYAEIFVVVAIIGIVGRYIFLNGWYDDRLWLAGVMIGIPILLLSARHFKNTSERASPIYSFEDRIWWIPIVLLTSVFRVLPYVANMIPDGLVWEEHESAWMARAYLEGDRSALMFGITTRWLSLFLYTFGLTEFSLRLSAIVLSTLSVFFLAIAARFLFPPLIALFVTTIYLTDPVISMAGFLTDEGFSIVQFIQIGIIASGVSLIATRKLGSAILLGLFSAIGLFEYAPLKLLAILGPILTGIFLIASLLSDSRLSVQGRIATALNSCTYFLLSWLLIGAPMIYSIATGGNEFFDGRRQVMIGSDAASVWAAKIADLENGILTHLQFGFLGGYRTDFLKLEQWPPLSPGLWIGLILIFPLIAFLIIRGRGTQSREDRRQFTITVVAVASSLTVVALSIAVCAIWNSRTYNNLRLLACAPLLAITTGGVLTILKIRWPIFTHRLVQVLIPIIVGINTIIFIKFLTQSDLPISFRDRTQALCSRLDGSKETHILAWDWEGISYMGDSDVTVWAKDPTKSGYDAWPCKNTPQLIPVFIRNEVIDLSVVESMRSIEHIIVGTRARTDTELKNDLALRTNQQLLRIARYLGQLSSVIEMRSCRVFPSSSYFTYAICPFKPDQRYFGQ